MVKPPDPVQLQKSYWAFNAAEKTALLNRYPDSLAWSELLRLQHLLCLEQLDQKIDGKRMIDAEKTQRLPAENPLLKDVTEKLMSAQSPYRKRHCEVWQRQADEPRPPDMGGVFCN